MILVRIECMWSTHNSLGNPTLTWAALAYSPPVCNYYNVVTGKDVHGGYQTLLQV